MPVQVMLETAGISGFDADADPGDIPLLSGAVSFIDPFSRPLRIHVTPIQLHGLFGGVVASASGGSVVQALKNEIPEMLSLPPEYLCHEGAPVPSEVSLSGLPAHLKFDHNKDN